MSEEQRTLAGKAAHGATDAGREDAATPAAERDDRRAALERIGRWVLVAPAIAVLVDPEHAHAYLLPGGGD